MDFTIGHERANDPQLILHYEDALVRENTGMVEELGDMKLALCEVQRDSYSSSLLQMMVKVLTVERNDSSEW